MSVVSKNGVILRVILQPQKMGMGNGKVWKTGFSHRHMFYIGYTRLINLVKFVHHEQFLCKLFGGADLTCLS